MHQFSEAITVAEPLALVHALLGHLALVPLGIWRGMAILAMTAHGQDARAT
jgi:hypothetical protein